MEDELKVEEEVKADDDGTRAAEGERVEWEGERVEGEGEGVGSCC